MNISAETPLLIKLYILSLFLLSTMSESDDYYQKYIQELIIRIHPQTYNSAIILLSTHNVSYQDHFKQIREHAKKAMNGVPSIYAYKNHQLIIDFNKYLLRNGENKKAALLNMLYLFGQIKNIKIILTIPYHQHNLKQILKESLQRFLESFSQKFLSLRFSSERQIIIKSVGLLFFDVPINQSQQLRSHLQVLATEEQQLQEIIVSILEQKNIYSIDDKINLQIIEKMERGVGGKLSPLARQDYFRLTMANQGGKQERIDEFFNRIEYMKKIFHNTVSLLVENFEFLLDEQKRQKVLQLFKEKQILNNKIFHNQHRVHPKTHRLIRLLTLLNELWELKKKSDKLFEGYIREGSPLNQVILFYELISILTKWKIISEKQYFQESHEYLFALFIKICCDTFPFIKIMDEIQIKSREIIPPLILTLLKVVAPLLQQQIEEIFDGKKPKYKIYQAYQLINNFIQSTSKSEEQIFFTGARIKERLHLVHIQYTFNYYTKAINYFTRREKIQWAIKCQELLFSSFQEIPQISHKNIILKTIYLQLANWLKAQHQYQLSLILYEHAYAYYSYVEVAKLWIQSIIEEKQKIQIPKLQIMVNKIGDMGLEEDAKEILSRYYSYSQDLREMQSIILKQKELSHRECLLHHSELLGKMLGFQIELISRECMEQVKKIFKQRYELEVY